MGDRGEIAGTEASPVGNAVAAMHACPQTAVGKTVLRFGVVEVLGELLLGDVGNQADMGARDLQLLAGSRTENGGGEMTTIPRTVEQGR